MLSAYTNVLAHRELSRLCHVKFLHSEITSEVVFGHLSVRHLQGAQKHNHEHYSRTDS